MYENNLLRKKNALKFVIIFIIIISAFTINGLQENLNQKDGNTPIALIPNDASSKVVNLKIKPPGLEFKIHNFKIF